VDEGPEEGGVPPTCEGVRPEERGVPPGCEGGVSSWVLHESQVWWSGESESVCASVFGGKSVQCE